MSRSLRANLVLRVATEVGVVVALAWWGAATGASAGAKVALGIVAPVVGFGLWGALDFRRAGRFAEPLRLLEELSISGLASAGWYVAGQHVLCWVLVALSVAHHLLVYALGDRLVRSRHGAPGPRRGGARSRRSSDAEDLAKA